MSQILFFIALSFGAHAELDSRCATVDTPVPWAYCVHETVGSTSTDVVYHLHGAGENVYAYVQKPEGELIRQAWAATGKPAPIVVSVSFGPFWLLASKNQSANSGLYDVFVRAVLPHIEQHVLKMPPTARFLFGYSMGGYNGSQLYLKNPELFRKVVLGCPAFANVSPYASRRDIRAYIARTHADRRLVKWSLQISKVFYADDAAYALDAPIANAAAKLTPNHPPLHLSCGDRDEFGFYEGASLFRDAAAARGVNLTWEKMDGGGHCALDPASIANFLQ